jgi:hypothetical protein
MNRIGQDAFEGTAGTDLAAHAPDIGISWEKVEDTGAAAQTIQLTGLGTAELNTTEANSRCIFAFNPGPSVAESNVGFTLVVAGTGSNDKTHLVARYVDNSNWYAAEIGCSNDNPDVKIAKKVAGTVTTLASANASPANLDLYVFEVRNGAKRLLENGVEILTTTDNALTAAGRAGLAFGNLVVATDDANTNIEITDFFVDEVVVAKAPPVFHRPLRIWSH